MHFRKAIKKSAIHSPRNKPLGGPHIALTGIHITLVMLKSQAKHKKERCPQPGD